MSHLVYTEQAGDQSPPSTWEELEAVLNAEFACACSVTELRRRTCSNGTKQYRRQCLRCGKTSNNLPNAATSWTERARAEEIDQALQDEWQARRNARRQELAASVLEQQAEERRAEYDARLAEQLEELSRYYETPEWKQKARRRLEMDAHRCQAGLQGCAGRATQAHHLTYTHVFNEPLFDLVSVCERCHWKITQLDRERRRRLW